MNSPSGNIGAAAEHTIALLLAVARNIPDGCASLKAGKWERSRLVGVEVKGKTLGVIGIGKGIAVGCKVKVALAHVNSWNHRGQTCHRTRNASGGT